MKIRASCIFFISGNHIAARECLAKLLNQQRVVGFQLKVCIKPLSSIIHATNIFLSPTCTTSFVSTESVLGISALEDFCASESDEQYESSCRNTFSKKYKFNSTQCYVDPVNVCTPYLIDIIAKRSLNFAQFSKVVANHSDTGVRIGVKSNFGCFVSFMVCVRRVALKQLMQNLCHLVVKTENFFWSSVFQHLRKQRVRM